jgi:hypothetical protein
MTIFENQIDFIKKGLGVTQIPLNSGELKLTAHECALIRIIFNKDQFYQEICKVLYCYLDKKSYIEAVNILDINLAMLPDYEPSVKSFDISVLEKNIFNITNYNKASTLITSKGSLHSNKDEFMKSLVKGGRRVSLNQLNEL